MTIVTKKVHLSKHLKSTHLKEYLSVNLLKCELNAMFLEM